VGYLAKPEAVVAKILRNNVSGVGYVPPTAAAYQIAPLKAERIHAPLRSFYDEALVVGVVVKLPDVEVNVVGYFLAHSLAHIATRCPSLGYSSFMTSSDIHLSMNSVIFSFGSGFGIGMVYESLKFADESLVAT
jgi:hypothetical protein